MGLKKRFKMSSLRPEVYCIKPLVIMGSLLTVKKLLLNVVE